MVLRASSGCNVMFRFLSFALASLAVGLTVLVACSDAAMVPAARNVADGGTFRRDAAPVDPTEASAPEHDAPLGPPPSCERYCDLVMKNCTEANAQYASVEECHAFCVHLPLTEPMGRDDKQSASVACRQYWADGPAQTSPAAYCLAAGPFGGNTCGDRCTAFCTVALSACSPDGGVTAYASQPECASACAGFAYRDAATDGGGETPGGPAYGDSLNCRLYWLRGATMNAAKCLALSPKSDICSD
jgi:hypothetical protein